MCLRFCAGRGPCICIRRRAYETDVDLKAVFLHESKKPARICGSRGVNNPSSLLHALYPDRSNPRNDLFIPGFVTHETKRALEVQSNASHTV